jgi:phosphohistidine phosphatase SixA
VLDIEPVETLDALVPGGSARKIIESLNTAPRVDTIVLVGHQPDLGTLAGLLLFNSTETPLPIKKAGACGIRFETAVRPGAGKLEWSAPPSMLCRLTRRKVAV